MTKLTERASTNPKRSRDEVSRDMAKLAESKKITLAASTDYLASIGNGFTGWYVCRSEKSLAEVEIKRVKPRVAEKWRIPTPEEVLHIRSHMSCSSVILPMNHWFRGGGSRHFRCPINFCEYQPSSQKHGRGCGFYLVMYDESGRKYFIPATPPMGMIENKVALLKLMFCEENLPALMSDVQDVADYWKVINEICASEYAVLSADCDQIEVTIRQPTFNIHETRASLNQTAVGRALKCTCIDKANMREKWWGDKEWADFLTGMFGHFRLAALPQEAWDSLQPAQRRMLREIDRVHSDKPVLTSAQVLQMLVKGFGEEMDD